MWSQEERAVQVLAPLQDPLPGPAPPSPSQQLSFWASPGGSGTHPNSGLERGNEAKIQTHVHLRLLVSFHKATSCPFPMIWMRGFFLFFYKTSIWYDTLDLALGLEGTVGGGSRQMTWGWPQKDQAPITQEASSQHPPGFWGPHYCLVGLPIMFGVQIELAGKDLSAILIPQKVWGLPNLGNPAISQKMLRTVISWKQSRS